MASARHAKSPGAGTPGHVRKSSASGSPAPARLSLHSVTPADQEEALASPTVVKSGRSSSPSAVQEGGEAMHVQGAANTPPHVHVRNSIVAGDAAATPKVSSRTTASIQSADHLGEGKMLGAFHGFWPFETSCMR